MSIYIDSIARKFAHDQQTKYCVLFNTALTMSIEYHESNGWENEAEVLLKKFNYTRLQWKIQKSI